MSRRQNSLKVERQLGDWIRTRLPQKAAAFVMFVLKQGWACAFGGLMLAALIISSALWQADWAIARYDALLGFALTVQILFLRFRLETIQEAKVILLFHLTGTAMELFKVSAGSWAYPEDALFKIFGVPLFSGFMYAAVGSYIARVIRLFSMQFSPYPPFAVTLVLAVAIYVNFFSHHFLPDIRLGLFAATLGVYWRCWITFYVEANPYRMPFLLAALLSACALWIAENIGTLTQTWVYAGNAKWHFVGLDKMGSWYLLLFVSFVTVTLVLRDALKRS